MNTRSSGQEPTTLYSEPESFIHRTKMKKKRNPFIPVEDRVPKVKYPPFESLFEALVVYNPFSDLPFPMANDQPMWGNNRAVAPTPGAVIVTLDLGDNFTIKVNPNAKTTVIHDDSEDEADEAEKEVEPPSSKQVKSDPPPLKAYKPKISYPQRLYKKNMEERYAKFIDLIKEVRINISFVDVLAGMPNYRKFLKDLVSNKSKMEQIFVAFLNEECSAIVQNKLPPKLGDSGSFLILCTVAGSVKYLALADLGASINLMPYSLYLPIPDGNSRELARLRRPFLHTADAIIRVKNKELNLGVGDDRITFLFYRAMQHSHSNDDTCFRMDAHQKKINESSLDEEFKEFMTVDVEEIPEQEEEVKDNFDELPLEENLRIKTSI
ncbi:hypothetical protein Tco_0508846 [Tanacetum coccineum]